MPYVSCTYTVSAGYEVPPHIKLLSIEENKKAKKGTPFSWRIKWDKLHYYDAEGKKHKVDGYRPHNDEYKHPDDDSIRVDMNFHGTRTGYESFLAQLNYGVWFYDGRHEKTSDADWALLTEAEDEETYTEEMYNRLERHLIERDGFANVA